MTRSEKLSRFLEVATALAVVASLVYVGREVQQNTAAVQASSSQAAYEMAQERLVALIENRDYAGSRIRVRDDPSSLSAVDSLRYGAGLQHRLNLYEMVHTNPETGTMATDMAEAWLADRDWIACDPLAPSYWAQAQLSYTPSFVARMQAAIAGGRHSFQLCMGVTPVQVRQTYVV